MVQRKSKRLWAIFFVLRVFCSFGVIYLIAIGRINYGCAVVVFALGYLCHGFNHIYTRIDMQLRLGDAWDKQVDWLQVRLDKGQDIITIEDAHAMLADAHKEAIDIIKD